MQRQTLPRGPTRGCIALIDLCLPGSPLTVLAVGAHPDDIEIGCGGTLLGLCARGEVDATSVVLTGSPSRQAEARDASRAFLGAASTRTVTCGYPDGRLPAYWDEVKTDLERLAADLTPDLVLAPRPDDAHQDHRLLAQLVPTVWRDSLVLQYEIPKWDGDLRAATHYVPVPDEMARRKVALLDAVYPSQRARDWWDEETFLGLMRLRGIECRSRYAEAFLVDKAVLTL